MSEEREEEKPESSEAEPETEPTDEPIDSIDPEEEEKMRKLLRGALGGPSAAVAADEGHVLSGVQRRIRERSGGKFYDEGWSTSKQSPTYTYLYTSLVMLVIVGVVYSFLSSLSDKAAEVENTPAPVPVRIVFPKK